MIRALLVLALLLAAACGPRTVQARMEHSEKRAGQAEAALDEAEASLQALDPDRAEKRIERAREAISDPDFAYYPERELLRERLARAEANLPVVRKEKARREL